MSLNCILFLVVLLKPSTKHFVALAEEPPITIIGIFSECSNSTNKTIFNNQSLVMRNNILWHRKNLGFMWKGKDFYDHDVCFDFKKLSRFIIELLLDSRYQRVHLNGTMDMDTIVLSVMAYIPTDMFKLLQEVLSFTRIVVITGSANIDMDSFHAQNKHIVTFQSYISTIDVLIHQRLDWEQVTVVHLKRNNDFDQVLQHFKSSYESLIELFGKQNDRCVRASSLLSDSASIKHLISLLEKNPDESHGIIVIAEMKEITKLVNNIALNGFRHPKTTIILLDSNGFFGNELLPLRNISIYTSSNQLRILTGHAMHFDNFVQSGANFLELGNLMSFLISLSRSIYEADGDSRLRHAILQYLLGVNREKIYLQEYSTNYNSEETKVFPNKSKGTRCTVVVCPPGKQKAFGILPNVSTQWDLEIGFRCDQCPLNHIKTTFGDSKCKLCPGYFISNKIRTLCIDPFQSHYFTFSSVEGYLCLMGSVFTGSLASFTIVVYAWKRHTPIVKISDRTFTFFHLWSLMIINIILPFVYIGKPSILKCVSRPVAVGLLYNLNISIVLVKSNKMVQAFQSKIRITSSEIRQTTLTQWFVVLLNLIGALMLIIFLQQVHPAAVHHKLNFKTMLRLEYCSNEGHLNVFNAFLIVIQLACMIQAFRCRKVPDHLNEVTSILYLSFITTVSSTILYPIYFFQKNRLDASLVHFSIFTCNNGFILCLLYSRNVFVLLFRPHLNTTHHFRQQQMIVMKIKAKAKFRTEE